MNISPTNNPLFVLFPSFCRNKGEIPQLHAATVGKAKLKYLRGRNCLGASAEMLTGTKKMLSGPVKLFWSGHGST